MVEAWKTFAACSFYALLSVGFIGVMFAILGCIVVVIKDVFRK